MKFYTVEKIGPKRQRTPEGFLLCLDVPLARTGVQLYGPDETPIAPGPDGHVKIQRDPEEVFREETIASANGKPLVNDHPDDDVNPTNWRELALGTILNPRRGTGADDDVLLGDILVTDADAIELIEGGKRQISLGYDADYEETGPGRGRHKDILINHAALVEVGRCGPRCSIGDRSTTHDCSCKENDMPKRATMKDRLMRLLNTHDEAEFQEAINAPVTGDEDTTVEPDNGETHIHIHQGAATEPTKADPAVEDEEEGELPAWFTKYVSESNARFDKLEQMISALGGNDGEDDAEEVEKAMAEEAPEGTKDRARKARDSAFLEDSFQETAAMAEIIVPGIRIPTFDRELSPKKTLSEIMSLRTRCLDLAYSQVETRDMIDEFLNGAEFNPKAMTFDAIRNLFRAVGAIKKRVNGRSTTDRQVPGSGGGIGIRGPIKNMKDYNKRMSEIYNAH